MVSLRSHRTIKPKRKKISLRRREEEGRGEERRRREEEGRGEDNERALTVLQAVSGHGLRCPEVVGKTGSGRAG